MKALATLHPGRVDIDVGGTFAEVVCVREERPPIVFKVPSTSAHPGDVNAPAQERTTPGTGSLPSVRHPGGSP